MTNLTTTTQFNKVQLPIMDTNNPFINPNITILTDMTAESAYALTKQIIGEGFTYTELNNAGVLILTNDGIRFGYFSKVDATFTISSKYFTRTDLFINPRIESDEDVFASEDTATTTATNVYTVAFTGHRPKHLPGNDYNYNKPESFAILNSMYFQLKERAEKHGSIRVVSGMAQGIDQLAIIAADKLRSNLGADRVSIHGAIPCLDFENGWKNKKGEVIQSSVDMYRKLLALCDTSEIVYKDGDYIASKKEFAGQPQGENCAMGKRNVYMVEMANEVLAYWNGKSGGTGNCVNSANTRNKLVTVINPVDLVAPVSNTAAQQPQQQAVQQQPSNEDELMAQHYEMHYNNYNNVNAPVDLEADRSKYAGSFGAQQPADTTQQTAQRRVLTVDGACSGNPGTFEFQAVWKDNGERLLHKHYGALKGTNNIAEFLGLATVAHHIIKHDLYDTVEVHTDSVTAMAWVKACKHNSKSKNVDAEVYNNLDAACNYLQANKANLDRIVIKKHDTKAEGEIAADFGNKAGK